MYSQEKRKRKFMANNGLPPQAGSSSWYKQFISGISSPPDTGPPSYLLLICKPQKKEGNTSICSHGINLEDFFFFYLTLTLDWAPLANLAVSKFQRAPLARVSNVLNRPFYAYTSFIVSEKDWSSQLLAQPPLGTTHALQAPPYRL